MMRLSVQYVCPECDQNGPKWCGHCLERGQQDMVEEFYETRPAVGSHTAVPSRISRAQSITVTGNARSAARLITEVSTESVERLGTGFSEFGRVLGGDMVPGSVTLITSEPDIGKSTLLLQTASNIARVVARDSTFRGTGQWPAQQSGRAQGGTSNMVSVQGNVSLVHANTVLHISGEGSQTQVRLRISRINAMGPSLLLASTTDLSAVLGLVEQNKPTLAIVDSAQTIVSQKVGGISGGPTQVREVVSALIDTTKTLDILAFLVGYVTEDGSTAGSYTLEHLVNMACQFEGDSEAVLRMLRAAENRFGPTDEAGYFDMSGEGIEKVTNPVGLSLLRNGPDAASAAPMEGICVMSILNGHRSLPIEVQALITTSMPSTPRRAVNDVDPSRIAMLVAALYRYSKLNLLSNDLYISTIAGSRAKEPGPDLTIVAALMNAAALRPITRATRAIGEISPTGQVRPVPCMEYRLREAARLGFTTTTISLLCKPVRVKGLRLMESNALSDTLDTLGVYKQP